MRQIDITYLNGPDIERAGPDRRRDPRRGRGRRCVAQGRRRDRDRAARAPDRPSRRRRVISTCCAATSSRSASPASRSSATSSTTTSRACRRRWRCSTCSIPRPACRKALLDATAITDMRTGAMTALGAKYLARKDSKVLGHIGARGTAYWNVRLLDHLFDFDEIRVHSRRPESREAFGARLSRDLGKPVRVTDDWESCLSGADILVEASRLPRADAALQDRMGRQGRLRRALRHHERGRALAHRHHGQDGGRRLGPVRARACRSARCGRMSRAQLTERTCTPSSARSSPA